MEQLSIERKYNHTRIFSSFSGIRALSVRLSQFHSKSKVSLTRTFSTTLRVVSCLLLGSPGGGWHAHISPSGFLPSHYFFPRSFISLQSCLTEYGYWCLHFINRLRSCCAPVQYYLDHRCQKLVQTNTRHKSEFLYTDVLATFWHLLWSTGITKQTLGNMEFTCFIS